MYHRWLTPAHLSTGNDAPKIRLKIKHCRCIRQVFETACLKSLGLLLAYSLHRIQWGTLEMRALQLESNITGTVQLLINRLRTFIGSGVVPCAVLLFTLSSCNQQILTPLEHFLMAPTPSPEDVTVNFCTDPAVQQKFAVKTLIIFDHSGSNKQNYQMAPDGSGVPYVVNNTINISASFATDPTGTLRYGTDNTPGTLLNFLSTTPPNDPLNPSRYFALIDFSDAATTYPANSSGFTSDTVDFYNYVKAESTAVVNGLTQTPNDSGATSYISALKAAYDVINFDVQNAKKCAALPKTNAPTTNCPSPGVQVSSSYVIVFMSDGSPITDISGIGVDSSGHIVVTGAIAVTREDTNKILGSVQTIMGLTADTKFVAGVNLFSIYYYNPTNAIDGTGQALLAQMAKLGNGLHYNAVSGSKIDYSRFVPPSKLVKYTLSDIFVTNSSTVWGSDGTLKVDTDGDGLSDELEIATGSDPNKKDSNGNGVSDFVEYQLAHGTPCTLKNGTGRCIDTPINYAATACSGVSSSVVSGQRVFAATDPNGLNDCEKIILGDVGGINNPDSNGDTIPDWLEFKNGVPFQLGADPASTLTGADGYSAYQKIKLSLPTNLPLTQFKGLTPAHYQLTPISSNGNQDCYKLDVTNLTLIGSNNLIRVDVVEKSDLLQDKYLYRTAQKVSPGTNGNLIFNDWNNAGEISAGTWKKWP